MQVQQCVRIGVGQPPSHAVAAVVGPAQLLRANIAVCLADLAPASPLKPLAADSPLNVEDLAASDGNEDDDGENVGDTTPHKHALANPSASENLSLSQYLSSSFH